MSWGGAVGHAKKVVGGLIALALLAGGGYAVADARDLVPGILTLPSRSRPGSPHCRRPRRAQRLTRPRAHQGRDRCRHRRSARRPVPGWRRGSRGPGHHVGRGPGVHRRRAPTDHRLHPEDPFGAGHHRCPRRRVHDEDHRCCGRSWRGRARGRGDTLLATGPGTRPPSWARPVSVTSPLRSLRPHPLVRSPSVSTPRMPRAHRSRPRGTPPM